MKSKQPNKSLAPVMIIQDGYVEIGEWFCEEIKSKAIGIDKSKIVTEIKFSKPGYEDTYIEFRHTGDQATAEFKAGQFYTLGFAPRQS